MGIIKVAFIGNRVFRFISTKVLPSTLAMRLALGLIVLIFLYMVIKYFIHKRIKTFYNPTALNKSILENLRKRIKSYSPTFYLPHTFLKIVVMMKSKRLANKAIYLREYVKLNDGEVIGLDMYPKNHKELEKDTPTIIFVPGLNGTSTNYYSGYLCKLCTEEHPETKFRVGVMNKRGLGGMPIVGSRITNLDIYEDLIEVVKHVSKQFHTKNIYLIGFSLGSIYVLNALQSGRLDGLVKGASIAGCPWKWRGVLGKLKEMPFIDNRLTRKHISLLAEHLHEPTFFGLMNKNGITEGIFSLI